MEHYEVTISRERYEELIRSETRMFELERYMYFLQDLAREVCHDALKVKLME